MHLLETALFLLELGRETFVGYSNHFFIGKILMAVLFSSVVYKALWLACGR